MNETWMKSKKKKATLNAFITLLNDKKPRKFHYSSLLWSLQTSKHSYRRISNSEEKKTDSQEKKTKKALGCNLTTEEVVKELPYVVIRSFKIFLNRIQSSVTFQIHFPYLLISCYQAMRNSHKISASWPIRQLPVFQ